MSLMIITGEIRMITAMLVLMKMIVSNTIVISERMITITNMINQNQYGWHTSKQLQSKTRSLLNLVKDRYAAGKQISDVTSPGGLRPAELEKVIQVINEVMTIVTAVAKDLNRLQELRTETCSRPI